LINVKTGLVFCSYLGADGYNVPDVVCDIYFEGKSPCFGGVMAIDGRTGSTLWTQWVKHEIFALTCQGDLNNDTTVDCVAGGRAGVSSLNQNYSLWPKLQKN
jgi:hypothetical protein